MKVTAVLAARLAVRVKEASPKNPPIQKVHEGENYLEVREDEGDHEVHGDDAPVGDPD